MRLSVAISFIIFTGCLSVPDGIQPVEDFDLDLYLGKWYEIARLDHSFERGLDRVTAEYSLRDDGGIQVVNRGYSKENEEWEEVTGKAYFVNDESYGHLKVSFFGPLYSSYVVFGLDQDQYQYAFVSGPTTTYLWLLSRSPEVSPELIDRFREKAGELGFDTEQLIYVSHD